MKRLLVAFVFMVHGLAYAVPYLKEYFRKEKEDEHSGR